MNFGTILNSVTKTCVTMMVESKDKESKSLARNFIKYIHLKEVLDKQFRVYHQLNSSFIKDKESARIFVNETLSILEQYKFEDILSYNHLIESRFDISKQKSTEINMAIATLIKYKTSSNKRDQEGFVNSLEKIVKHVSTIKEDSNFLSSLNEAMANSEIKYLQPKHIIRIALKKFNKQYSNKFDMEDKIIFNTLREGNKKKIQHLYDTTIENLKLESNNNIVTDELKDKMNIAINEVSSGYSQTNLLNAHELRSELIRLKEES